MSELDGPLSSANPLESLLKRWPVECRLHEELVLSAGRLSIPAPAAVVVRQGNVWAQVGSSPSRRLTTGDILVVHLAEALELDPQAPDNDLPGETSWLPADEPVQAPTVVRIALEPLTPAESARLLPPTFVTPPPAHPHDHLALAVNALLGTTRGPVSRAVRDAAATLVYLECVHRYLLTRSRDVIWLTGLFDPEIGPVVAAMIDSPARDWTVESLADAGGMSRSAFARKFREQMGLAPIDFLVEVRMWNAARQLRQQSRELKAISREAGYQSPAAFSVAFKRWCGATPSEYRKNAQGG